MRRYNDRTKRGNCISSEKIIAYCLIIAFGSLVCYGDEKAKTAVSDGTEKPKAIELSGTYTCKDFSMMFEKGKCFLINKDDKDRLETKYLIRNDKVYIAPIVPKGETMTRNVWVVYAIKGQTLESSHVEDMDTGDVFYKDEKPSIVLTKEQSKR